MSGPACGRLRRDLGLTQADMAADLEVSASYVALLERNHRPLTAEMLLRLAQTYKLDMATLAGDDSADDAARLQAVLKDPMFADIDLPALEISDLSPTSRASPRRCCGFTRLSRGAAGPGRPQPESGGGPRGRRADPVAESRRFLAARRNSFPTLDDAGRAPGGSGRGAERTWSGYLKARKTRPARPAHAVRRHGRLDPAATTAPQADPAGRRPRYRQPACSSWRCNWPIWRCAGDRSGGVDEGVFTTDSGERLTRRALASYAAAAHADALYGLRPGRGGAALRRRALARQFGTSFEQTAHRLTTLQKPGQERVPFFFIRVDPAGNVSKRLDGANSRSHRHGGGCPLWSVHQVFRTPREIVTQWLELPDGQRFFSIARTVTAGGGAFGEPRVERAIALGCAAEHADRLIYTQGLPAEARRRSG
jgi:transcriptional regulator with XRE-family HTH domain